MSTITPIEFVAQHGDPTTWTPADYETYENLTHCDLDLMLDAEDDAEAAAIADGSVRPNRVTCPTHQCWAADCADHPLHTHLHRYALLSS